MLWSLVCSNFNGRLSKDYLLIGALVINDVVLATHCIEHTLEKFYQVKIRKFGSPTSKKWYTKCAYLPQWIFFLAKSTNLECVNYISYNKKLITYFINSLKRRYLILVVNKKWVGLRSPDLEYIIVKLPINKDNGGNKNMTNFDSFWENFTSQYIQIYKWRKKYI